MQESEYIAVICQKEIKGLCYRHKIDGISVYNYIKRQVRSLVLEHYGYSQDLRKEPLLYGKIIASFFCSLWQVSTLVFLNKRATFFIYSFFRTDSVNGIYLDKFTDPLIEYTSIKDSYVIFDRGNNGIHRKPRLHHKRIVYTDALNDVAYVWAYLFVKFFIIRNKKVLEGLWQSIDLSFPEISYSKNVFSRQILYLITLTRIYSFLMRRMGVQYMLAPARHAFLPLIPAAKGNGIKVFELQHGITYGESLTYSGFRDVEFTPDCFLTFGEMHPSNVYGIDEERIVNIGWAFGKYIKDNARGQIVIPSDVLVISEPQITDRIINVISTLAIDNPSLIFCFRPHPLEVLTVDQMRMLEDKKNIIIDDNKQNIQSTLTRFKFVIGENSTVLYEAVSMGKRVGKISMGGLRPLYLQEEDKLLFWNLSDSQSFKLFISDDSERKLQKSIYSTFSSDKFNTILGISNR